MVAVAERIRRIPPYLFSVIDERKERLGYEKKDLIDLGMGNPDLPTSSPSYPVYFNGALLAGGVLYRLRTYLDRCATVC